MKQLWILSIYLLSFTFFAPTPFAIGMGPKIIQGSSDELASALADRMYRVIKANNDQGQATVMILPTGRSPIPTYQQLIQKVQKAHGESSDFFKNFYTFNLDEYATQSRKLANPDKAPSYQHFMHQNLFQHVEPHGFDRKNAFFPGVSSDPMKPEAYDALLDRVLSSHGKDKVDFELLGIGTNGHIAFNEPGTAFDSATRFTKLTKSTVDTNKEGFDHAFTMGIHSIMKAKEMAVIATGSSKADAVFQALRVPSDANVPASYLQKHPNVSWYVDPEAYSLGRMEFLERLAHEEKLFVPETLLPAKTMTEAATKGTEAAAKPPATIPETRQMLKDLSERELEQVLKKKKHVVIGAHPDDGDLLMQRPKDSLVVILTNGDSPPKSGPYQQYTKEQMASTRHAEQTQAAVRGEYPVITMSYRSSDLKKPSSEQETVVNSLRAIIEKVKPETVITHSAYDLHPTHRATLKCAIKALGKCSHQPKELLGSVVWGEFGGVPHTHKRDFPVPAQELERRIHIARAHVSQNTPGKDMMDAMFDRYQNYPKFLDGHQNNTGGGVIPYVDHTELIRTPSLKNYLSQLSQNFSDEVYQLKHPR